MASPLPLFFAPPAPRPSPVCHIPDRRRELYPEASDAEWGDWRWQARNMVGTLEELERRLVLSPEEREGVAATAKIFRLGITPYYLSLIDPRHPLCPIRRQAIPLPDEARIRPGELRGPAGRGQDPSDAGHRAPLSRPRAAAGHRSLHRLLPPLHPAPAHRVAARASSIAGPARGGRLPARAPRGARRADLGRRPAACSRTLGSRSCSGRWRRCPRCR